MPSLPDPVPSAEHVFANMSYEDVWQDGEVVSLCHWLRGGPGLENP